MEINRIHEVSAETEQRLLNHGLTLVLDYDTTGEYCHVPTDLELAVAEVHTAGDSSIARSTVLVSKLDQEINEKIDSVIEYINNAGQKSITLTVDFKDSFLREHINPTAYICEKINKQFGFMPAFGTIQINERLCRYKINMLINDAKSFFDIAQTGRPDLNYHVQIKEHLGSLMEANYYEPPASQEEVLDLLTSRSSYDRWSQLMINALMMMIFEYVEGVEFINATPVLKSLKPVRK